MQAPSDAEIQSIVRQVMDRLGSTGETRPASAPSAPIRHQVGVFDDLEAAVRAADEAQRSLLEMTLAKRKLFIEVIRKACHQYVNEFSESAVSETKLGRADDKVLKNRLVIDKTPGPEILEPETFTGDDGMALQELAPVGLIAAVTPCTNPTETIICNGIGMLAAGNAVVFNPHPLAKNVSARCVEVINEAVISAGGPANLICSMREPTIESAQALMRHPKVRMVVVTGGPAVVAEAMRSGKKVIAAGPGNPPVVVDETADLDVAGKGIVRGASLDNNIVCTDEKEVFAVDSVVETLKKAMAKYGGFELTEHQRSRLERVVVDGDHPNKKWIGQDARKILAEIGVEVGNEIRLIFCEAPKDHPFVQLELLMPVIPIVRVRNAHEGIVWAKEVEHGFRHTASMYSRNIDNLHEMARTIDVSIFTKNAPNYAGLGMGGEGYTSFTIAGPTGEGMTTARDFTRVRRCTLVGRFRII